MPINFNLASAFAAAAAASTLLFAPAASADVTCTKVAAPTGSDSAAGTVDAPYRTAQKLVNSMTAGDTGCLRAGDYNEDVKVTHGGTAGNRVTLTSFPGERANFLRARGRNPAFPVPRRHQPGRISQTP